MLTSYKLYDVEFDVDLAEVECLEKGAFEDDMFGGKAYFNFHLKSGKTIIIGCCGTITFKFTAEGQKTFDEVIMRSDVKRQQVMDEIKEIMRRKGLLQDISCETETHRTADKYLSRYSGQDKRDR
ncbi:MAG: hypothetical protein WAZ18_07525 [Alphaproteobacteria bacterium]